MQRLIGSLENTCVLVDDIGTQVLVAGLTERDVYVNKPPVQKTTGIVVADPDAPPELFTVKDFTIVSSDPANGVRAPASLGLLTTPSPRHLPPPSPSVFSGSLSGLAFAASEMARLGWSPWVYHQQQYLFKYGMAGADQQQQWRSSDSTIQPQLCYAVKLAAPTAKAAAMASQQQHQLGSGARGEGGADCTISRGLSNPVAVLGFRQQLYDYHHRKLIPIVDDDLWMTSDPGDIKSLQWLLPDAQHVLAAPSFGATGTVPDGGREESHYKRQAASEVAASSPTSQSPPSSVNKRGGGGGTGTSSPTSTNAEEDPVITAAAKGKYEAAANAIRNAISANASLAWCLFITFEKGVALVQLETAHSCGFDDKEKPHSLKGGDAHTSGGGYPRPFSSAGRNGDIDDYDDSEKLAAQETAYGRHPYSDVGDNMGGFTAARVVWFVNGKYNTIAVCPIDWHVALGYSKVAVGKRDLEETGADVSSVSDDVSGTVGGEHEHSDGDDADDEASTPDTVYATCSSTDHQRVLVFMNGAAGKRVSTAPSFSHSDTIGNGGCPSTAPPALVTTSSSFLASTIDSSLFRLSTTAVCLRYPKGRAVRGLAWRRVRSSAVLAVSVWCPAPLLLSSASSSSSAAALLYGYGGTVTTVGSNSSSLTASTPMSSNNTTTTTTSSVGCSPPILSTGKEVRKSRTYDTQVDIYRVAVTSPARVALTRILHAAPATHDPHYRNPIHPHRPHDHHSHSFFGKGSSSNGVSYSSASNVPATGSGSGGPAPYERSFMFPLSGAGVGVSQPQPSSASNTGATVNTTYSYTKATNDLFLESLSQEGFLWEVQKVSIVPLWEDRVKGEAVYNRTHGARKVVGGSEDTAATTEKATPPTLSASGSGTVASGRRRKLSFIAAGPPQASSSASSASCLPALVFDTTEASSSQFIIKVVSQSSTTHSTSGDKLKIIEVNATTGALYYHSYPVGELTVNGGQCDAMIRAAAATPMVSSSTTGSSSTDSSCAAVASSSPLSVTSALASPISLRGGGIYNPVALSAFVEEYGPIADLHALPQSAGDRAVCEVLGGSVPKHVVRSQLHGSSSASSSPLSKQCSPPSSLTDRQQTDRDATAKGLVKSPRGGSPANNNNNISTNANAAKKVGAGPSPLLKKGAVGASKGSVDDFDLVSDFEDLSESFCCIFDKTRRGNNTNSQTKGGMSSIDRIDEEMLLPMASLNHVVLERHGQLARRHLRVVVLSRSGACALVSIAMKGEAKAGVIEHLFHFGSPLITGLSCKTANGLDSGAMGRDTTDSVGINGTHAGIKTVAQNRVPPRVLDISKGVELRELSADGSAHDKTPKRAAQSARERACSAPISSSSKVLGFVPIVAVLYDCDCGLMSSSTSPSSDLLNESMTNAAVVHLYHVDSAGTHCVPLKTHIVKRRRDFNSSGSAVGVLAPAVSFSTTNSGRNAIKSGSKDIQKAGGNSSVKGAPVDSVPSVVEFVRPPITKEVVIAFMNVHCPSMVPRVDMLLTALKGDAEKLLKNLKTKHGVAEEDDSYMPPEMKASFTAPPPPSLSHMSCPADGNVAGGEAGPEVDKSQEENPRIGTAHIPLGRPTYVSLVLVTAPTSAKRRASMPPTSADSTYTTASKFTATSTRTNTTQTVLSSPRIYTEGRFEDRPAEAYHEAHSFVRDPKVLLLMVFDERRQLWGASEIICDLSPYTSSFARDLLSLAPITPVTLATKALAAPIAATALGPSSSHAGTAAKQHTVVGEVGGSEEGFFLANMSITSLVAGAISHGHHATHASSGSSRPAAVSGDTTQNKGGAFRRSPQIGSAATTFAPQFSKWGRSLAAFPAIPSLYSFVDLLQRVGEEEGGPVREGNEDLEGEFMSEADTLLRSLSRLSVSGQCSNENGPSYCSALVLQRHSTANVPVVLRWPHAPQPVTAAPSEDLFVLAARYQAHTNGASLYARRRVRNDGSEDLGNVQKVEDGEDSEGEDVVEPWELFVRLQAGAGRSTIDLSFACPSINVSRPSSKRTVAESEINGNCCDIPRSDVMLYKGPTVMSVVVLFGSVLMVFQLDPGQALSAPMPNVASDNTSSSVSQETTQLPSAVGVGGGGESSSFALVFAQCGVASIFSLPAAAKAAIANGKPIGGSNLAKPSLLAVTAVAPSTTNGSLFLASNPMGASGMWTAPREPSNSACDAQEGDAAKRIALNGATAAVASIPMSELLATPITFAIDLAAPIAASSGIHSTLDEDEEEGPGKNTTNKKRKVASFVMGNAYAAEDLLRCFSSALEAPLHSSSVPHPSKEMSSSFSPHQPPNHVIDLSGSPIPPLPSAVGNATNSLNSTFAGRTYSTATFGSGGGPLGGMGRESSTASFVSSPSSRRETLSFVLSDKAFSLLRGPPPLHLLSVVSSSNASGATSGNESGALATASTAAHHHIFRVEIISSPHRISKNHLATRLASLGGEASRAVSRGDMISQKMTLASAREEILMTALCVLRPPPKSKAGGDGGGRGSSSSNSLRSMVLVGGASMDISPLRLNNSSSSASKELFSSTLTQPQLYVAPLELLLSSPYTPSGSAAAIAGATSPSYSSSSNSIATSLAGPYPEAVELLHDMVGMFVEGRWPSLVRSLSHLVQLSRRHTNRIVASALLHQVNSGGGSSGGEVGGGFHVSASEDGVIFGGGGGGGFSSPSPTALADDPSVYLAELLAPPISSTPRPSEALLRSLVGQFLSVGSAPLLNGGGGGGIANDNDPQTIDLRSRVTVLDPAVVAQLHSLVCKMNTSTTNRSLITTSIPSDAKVAMSGSVDMYSELLEGLSAAGATCITESVVLGEADLGGGGDQRTLSAEILKFVGDHLGLRLHAGRGALKLVAESAVATDAELTLSPSFSSPVKNATKKSTTEDDVNDDDTDNSTNANRKSSIFAPERITAVVQPPGSHLSAPAASFLETLCGTAVETLTNCSIVGLSSAQQLEVFVALETIRSMIGQSGRTDTASKRLLTQWKQREINKKFAASSASFAPVKITSSAMCWAMLSDAQDQLLDTINPSSWDDCVVSGIPLWTKSLIALRRIAENIGKSQYGSSRNIKACALMYVLAKKVSSLISFARNSNEMRLHDFFSRDFSRRINQKAASANGFAAVSKGALTYGAAFFVLGGDAISAAMGVVQRTGDWMLGLLIVRLGYDDDAARIEEYLQYLEQSPDVTLSMWDRCALRWRQGQYTEALKELWSARDSAASASSIPAASVAGASGVAAPSSPALTSGYASSSSSAFTTQSSSAPAASASTAKAINESGEVLQFLAHCSGGVTVLARTRKEDILPLDVKARLQLASARHNAKRGLVAAASRDYLHLWVTLDTLKRGIANGSIQAEYTAEAEAAAAKIRAAEEAANAPPPKIQADFNTGQISMFGMDSDDDGDDASGDDEEFKRQYEQQQREKTEEERRAAAAAEEEGNSSARSAGGSEGVVEASDSDKDADEEDEDESDSDDDSGEESSEDDSGPSPPNIRPRPAPTYNVQGKALWLAAVSKSIPLLLVEARTFMSSYLTMVAASANNNEDDSGDDSGETADTRRDDSAASSSLTSFTAKTARANTTARVSGTNQLHAMADASSMLISSSSLSLAAAKAPTRSFQPIQAQTLSSGLLLNNSGHAATNLHGPIEYDEYGAPIRSRRAFDTSSLVYELLGILFSLSMSLERPPSISSKETLGSSLRELLAAYPYCSDQGARSLANPIVLWVLSGYAVASRSEALSAALCIVTIPLEEKDTDGSSAADTATTSNTAPMSMSPIRDVANLPLPLYLRQLAMATTVLRNETYQHFVHLSDLLESGAITGSALRLAELRKSWGGRMRHADDEEDVFRLVRIHASQSVRSLIALRAISASGSVLVSRLLLSATMDYFTLTKIMTSKRSYITHKEITSPFGSSSSLGPLIPPNSLISPPYEAYEASAAASVTQQQSASAALTASGHWSLHTGLLPAIDEIPAFAALRWSLASLQRVLVAAVDREVELQRQAHQALIVTSSTRERHSDASPSPDPDTPTVHSALAKFAAEEKYVEGSTITSKGAVETHPLNRKTVEALTHLTRTFCAFALIGSIRQPATVLWPLQSPLSAFTASSLQGQLLQEVSSSRSLVLTLECIANYRQSLPTQDAQLGMNGVISDHDGSLMGAMAAPIHVKAASRGDPTTVASGGGSKARLSSPFAQSSNAAFPTAGGGGDLNVTTANDECVPTVQPFIGANALEEVAWLYSLTHHTYHALREASTLMAVRCSTDNPQAELLPLLSSDPRSVGLDARREILSDVTEEMMRAAAASMKTNASSAFSSTTASAAGSGVRLMGGGSADSAGFFVSGGRLVGASPFSPVASSASAPTSFPSVAAATSIFGGGKRESSLGSTMNTGHTSVAGGSGGAGPLSASHTFKFRSSGLARDRTQLVSDSHGVCGIAVDRSSYDNLAVGGFNGLTCIHGMRDNFLAEHDQPLLREDQPLRESATEQFAASFRPEREGYGGWSHVNGVVSKFGSTGQNAAAIIGSTQRQASFASSFSAPGTRDGEHIASTLTGTSFLTSHPYLPVYVAVSSSGRCSIFQYGNDDRVAHFHDNACGQLSDVTFSPQGDNIVLTGSRGTIALWKFSALPAPFRLLPLHFTEAFDAKFIDNRNSVVAVVGNDSLIGASYTSGGGGNSTNTSSNTTSRFPFGNSNANASVGRGKLSIIDFALPHHHGLAATIELPFSNPAYVLHDPLNAPHVVGGMDRHGRIALFDTRAGRLMPPELTPRIELGSKSLMGGGMLARNAAPQSRSILSSGPSSKERDAAATGTATAVTLSDGPQQLLAVGTQCGDLALFSTRGFWGSSTAKSYGSSSFYSTEGSSVLPDNCYGQVPLQPVMATSTCVGRRPAAGSLNTLAVVDVVFTPSSLVYATGEGKVMGSPLISSVVRQLY